MSDSKYDQPIAGHDYDGIQEFDNPLPMWWLWTFFGTIIFSFVYYVHYELGGGPSIDQELKSDLAPIEALRKANSGGDIDSLLAAAISNAEEIAKGKQIFEKDKRCTSCHGELAGGLIGPNLADNYWIYGSAPIEIFNTITKGTPKSMPGWEAMLNVNERVSLVAYIKSIIGSNPPGAKAPEGTEVK